jgi:glucose-6-phosphate-specific signal transduction histidine kinase
MVGRTPEDALNSVLEAELARKEKQLAKFLADEESEREAFAKQRHDALVEAKAAGRIV